MNTNLDGRIALVAGAGEGVGLAIAHLLAANGATVVYADPDLPRAQQGAALSVRGRPLKLDVSDPLQISAGLAWIEREYGRLDILVNHVVAHSSDDSEVSLAESAPEQWGQALQADVAAVLLMSRAALPLMKRQQGGRIVNVASVLGVIPTRFHAARFLGQASVAHLTRALAIELGPEAILVNCVAVAPAGSTGDEFSPRLSHIPLGRAAGSDDAAYAVLYFVEADSSYVTGQVLCVDGGWSAGGFFRDY